jgi:hypothetical protein
VTKGGVALACFSQHAISAGLELHAMQEGRIGKCLGVKMNKREEGLD